MENSPVSVGRRLSGACAAAIVAGLALAFLLLAADPSCTAVIASTGTGFTIEYTLVLPVSPDVAYDVMTGDISGWWDHTFSDSPKALFIEPKPGGGFYEIFDDSGDGVLHATVNASGHIKDGWDDVVDGVWKHFLFEQLKPYIESGRYLEEVPEESRY